MLSTHATVAASSSSASDIPPGWSYNPSAWRERLTLIALAVIGLLAALYTALAQLGVVAAMWAPFFGSASSYAVTHSAISRLSPVPDGLLGVVGYLCEIIFGALGGKGRWRSRPWIVLVFAVVIVAMGIVSLLLTILQGAVIGQWCTVCIISAAVSTLILGLGIGEALASLQYLARLRLERGWAQLWRVLWGGTTQAPDAAPPNAPEIAPAGQGRHVDMGRWLQVCSIALGVWLMLSPAVLPATAEGASVARIAGPVVIWVGVLALRAVTRPFRALNTLSGMFLAIAPWAVSNTGALILSSVLSGWVIIILSIPRGRVRQHVGGGWLAAIQPELADYAFER